MSKQSAYTSGVEAATANWQTVASSWAPQTGGSHYFGGQNLNVVWQDTTSNATYCSAASALSAT